MKTGAWIVIVEVCLVALAACPADCVMEQPSAQRHYRHVGCFRDNDTRAIRYGRPLFNPESATVNCAAFAVSISAHAFGVQIGNSSRGTCFVKNDAHETYERYGQLDDKECIQGRGGYYKNSIYLLASQLRAPFTQAPLDPTYVTNGSAARLQWNFSQEVNHSYVEMLRDDSGSWTWLLRKYGNGTVTINTELPTNFTSKLAIEGNATLVISNFSRSDAGKYECRLVQFEWTTTEAPVHLELAGAKEPYAISCQQSNQSALCEHICISSDAAPKCGCRRGYQLTDDKCIDINECERQDTCAGGCSNGTGDVTCTCADDQDPVRGNASWGSEQTWWASLTYRTKRGCQLKRCGSNTHNNITWPQTEIRQHATADCPTGKTGSVKRTCEFKSGKATWGDPDHSNCVTPTPSVENPMPTTRSVNVNKSEAVQALDNMINSLANATLSPAESEKHMKTFASSLGTLVEGKPSPADIALAVEKSEQLGAALAQGMRRSGNLSGPVAVQVSTPTLDMGVNVLPPDNKSSPAPVIFPAAGSAEKVDLPGSMIALAQQKGQDGVAINSILLSNVESTSDPRSKRTLNSGIIATTVLFVDPKEFQNLKEPLTISLTHKKGRKENEKPVCAYLNITVSPPTWASHGCEVHVSNATYTVCHCYHATSFAVLLDVHGAYDGDSIPEDHRLALSIISIVGCSIALACFVIVLLAFFVSRRNTETVSIHKNFVTAEIMALFFFLVSYAAVPVRGLCFAVAVLLHYSLLCVFSWMLVEGLNIHRGMVKVFRTSSRMNIYLAIGWGVPLVVVAISAGYAREDYVRQDFCWLSHDLIWAFAGPAAFVLLANVIILCVAVKVMVRRTHYKVKREAKVNPDPVTVSKEIKAALKTLVVLTPLLGVTWVLGYMTVRGTSLVFQYLFTIINSLQGLYFLFAQFFFDDEIRKASKQASSRMRRTLSTSLSRSKSKRSNSTSSAVSPAPNSKSFIGAWSSPRPTLTRKGSSALNGDSNAKETGKNSNGCMDTKF